MGTPAPHGASGDYRALARFLDGYLHQDFRRVHGSAEGAARAFIAEASAAEVAAVAADLARLTAVSRRLPAEQRRRQFARIGGAWLPASVVEIVALGKVFREG